MSWAFQHVRGLESLGQSVTRSDWRSPAEQHWASNPFNHRRTRLRSSLQHGEESGMYGKEW